MTNEIPKDTILLTLSFPASQTLGVLRSIDDIFSSQQRDRNIVNFLFLKYTSEAVAKVATEEYKNDITSFKATVKKKKRPVLGPTQKHEECPIGAPGPIGATGPILATKSN